MKEFKTKELFLRKFKTEDTDEIYENWIKGKMLEDIVGFEQTTDNIEETKLMISSFIRESEWGEPKWVIEEVKTNKLIGYVGIKEVSRKNRACRVMFNITDCKKKGKKYLTEALEKVCEYLLFEDDFDIVFSKIYDSSAEISKIKSGILEEIGMKQEGRLRHIRINDKTKKSEDLTFFSIMKDDLKRKSS